METVPLAPIGGGLNESNPPGEQPQGTYSEGVNVRGIDPRTGRRVWGAQRAGLTQIGEAFPDGAYPRHFAFAAKLLSAREWTELGTTADPDADPTQVGIAWSERLGERVLDVAEGPLDGAGYFLLESGDVAVVNGKGTETERVYSAVPRGFTTVPRVYVDEQGAVYVAATRDTEFEGGAGRIWRYVKDEDDVWSAAWEAVIPGAIQTFVYRAGSMYFVETPVDADDAEALPSLGRIGAPTLGPTVLWNQTVIPSPVAHLEVTRRGQCLVSAPYSPERDGDANFTTRSVDWTPPELASWDVKGWAWLDAQLVNEGGGAPDDGEAVTRLLDRRFAEGNINPINEGSPRRDMFAADSDYFTTPTWDAEAFGGQGGVKFAGTAALISEPARTMPGTTGVGEAPGATHGTVIPTELDSWTVVMLVQFTDAQSIATALRNLITQRSDDITEADWRLIVNGLGVYVEEGNAGGTPVTSSTLTTAAVPKTAIISLVHNGFAVETYLNGALVAPAVTVPFARQDGPYAIAGSDVEVAGAKTVMGAGRPNRANLLNDSRAILYYYNGTANVEASVLERLRDGQKRASGADARVLVGPDYNAGNTIGTVPKIRIDLGAAIGVDSFAFWSTSSSLSAQTATVRFGNDASYATWTVQQDITVSRGAGDNQGVRDEYAIEQATGLTYRYIEIEPTTYYGSTDVWQISEFEVFAQDTTAIEAAADFRFGELVAINSIQIPEREFVEGYVAHRWGLAHTLDVAHPYNAPGAPPSGDGSANQDDAVVIANLNSPTPILAKYGTDGTPLAAYAGAGVGLGAIESDGRVWAIGDPQPPGDPANIADYGTLITRFDDGPRNLERTAGFASVDRPAGDAMPLTLGPCDSVFVPWSPQTGTDSLRRYDGDTLAQEWSLSVPGGLHAVATGGLQFDGSEQGLGCGPEFLYLAAQGPEGAKRVDVLGLRRTGAEAQRDVERLAVLSEGSVYRENGSGWELLESEALPGPLPYSINLNGLTIFADGDSYRVYNNATQRLREFEESVKGDFPPRCQLIAAYRGRMLLARGDNAFTIYQSAFGDPFDFDFGREVLSIEQAAAGTVASQGRVPEPITALMPYADDFLFIGTTESLWVLSGDLSDGGRLDQVDKSQGVAFGYAWCHAPRSIYYFSARGGVMQIAPQGGARMVSEGAIQRRLEDIDLEANKVRMAYNFIDKTVHVYVIPNNLGDQTQHFVYEELTGGWHVDDFGEGLGGVVTTADTLSGDHPDDRALMLGFADGRACAWDQYARDDAGRKVTSRAVVGPIVPDSANVEVRLAGARATLASDQGSIEVAARGSNTPDMPGAPGPFRQLTPGRGYGVPLNVTAPAVFLEVRGTGQPWSIHQMRAELRKKGRGRNIS